MNAPAPLGGILLTGGASQRMGFDKALLRVEGLANAARLAGELSQVVGTAVEVGPGRSGLPTVGERPPGAGPLVATCAGADALAAAGCSGPVLVVACDMPFLSAGVLKAIAGRPGDASVVPSVRGKLQPLCARWSQLDLALARRLVRAGRRSMGSLLGAANFISFGPADWPLWVGEEAFADVDDPADLAAWGLSP